MIKYDFLRLNIIQSIFWWKETKLTFAVVCFNDQNEKPNVVHGYVAFNCTLSSFNLNAIMIPIGFNIEISSEFGRKVSQLDPKENSKPNFSFCRTIFFTWN